MSSLMDADDGKGGGQVNASQQSQSVGELPHLNADLVTVLARAGVISVADVALLEHARLMELTGLGTLPAVEVLKAARSQSGVSPDRVRRQKQRRDDSMVGGLANMVTDQVKRKGEQQLKGLWRRIKPF